MPKQRGDAATDTGERQPTEAVADPVPPRKSRRSGDAEKVVSVAPVAHDVAASTVASDSGGRKKPKLKKRKSSKQEQSSCVASDADAITTATSGKVEGAPRDAQVSASPNLTEDVSCPEGNLVPEGKKPKIKKRKKIKQVEPPSAISDDATAVVAGSGNDCKNETYTPGNICTDAGVSLSLINRDEPDRPEVNTREQGTEERKKTKVKKQRKNKQVPSPSAAMDAGAVVADESGNDFPDEKGASGYVGVSMSPKNGGDTDRPEMNIGEKEKPEMKKPKLKKRKKNKQERPPPAVSDASDVVEDKSENDCPVEKGASGDVEVSMNPRNGGDTDHPVVNIGEKEIPEMKKPKRKKRKKNKLEQSSSAVSDTGAVVTDRSGNDCPDAKGASGDIEVSMNPRNGGDTDRPAVNIGETETPEMKKPKRKKRKKNKQEQSSSAVSDTCAVLTDKSGNDCPDEKGASGDVEVSMNPQNGGDTDRPAVNIGEKETPEMKKPKRKKRKKNKQEQSSFAVSDAGAVVTDKSGNDCPDEKGASGDVEVSMNPQNGGDTDCPGVNIGEKQTPEMKKPKRKKRKKNKHEQSSSAVSDAGAVVTDRSGNSSTNEEVIPGDADVSISLRNGNDPNIHNAPEDMAEEKQENEENSQMPKRRHEKKRNIDQVNVTVAPVVDVPSTGLIGKMDDENEPVLLEENKIKESMVPSICDSEVAGSNVSLTLVQGTETNEKAKAVCLQAGSDKSDFILNASTSGGNHKEKVQDVYSPRGSLVRFQRKKLLILDLNGLLADINQEHHYAHLAHAKVRGKLVFKRPYYDDFLKFCFQHFEVAIWSSRMKMNVDSVVDILMKDLKQHLLFCWDRSQCTTTGSNTLENRDKPLVFKELSKVWNKEQPGLPWEQGEFSPSNTLLVDDSPYKALRNPPHTAIFPYPYSYLDKNDDLLGPRGDLHVYLENLAAADNVQSYVRDHPFGQPSLTQGDPNWHFYVQVLEKVNRRAP